MTRRRLVILVVGIVGLAVLSVLRLSSPGTETPPSQGEDERQLVQYEGEVFGTTFSIKARSDAVGARSELVRATDQALAAVDQAMSTYKEASELSRLNRAPAGVPTPVSPPLLEVLALSSRVHQQTGGAFDVTVGPLVGAFGFGAGAQAEPPDEATLLALRDRVGAQFLHLDEDRQTVTKDKEGMAIDLSAVAKGYGVDQVALSLERLGIVDYLVEVGGEVRAKGQANATRPWKLGVERPDPDGRSLYGTLILRDAALATSGDYRSFRNTDEGVVSHTLDPRTGHPVPRRTASVSVVRPTAAEADALATALGALPPDEAMKLADGQRWAVLLLLHRDGGDFEPRMSASWRELEWEQLSPTPADPR